jgi:hypothetical protein
MVSWVTNVSREWKNNATRHFTKKNKKTMQQVNQAPEPNRNE